jgi:hypothetical protein
MAAAAVERTLIRLALPDRPGGLATVARCLAACGVDILSVEVVGHQDGEAIDDVLVTGGDLERALRALGGEVRLLGRRAGAELPDPALSMAEACGRVLAATTMEEARSALVAAVLRLCSADAGVLHELGESGRLAVVAASVPRLPEIAPDDPSLARRALRQGLPQLARGEDAWAPPAYRDALAGRTVLALPVGAGSALVLVVVRHDDLPFVDVEIERLGALVRTVLGGPHHATSIPSQEAGWTSAT